MVTNDFAANLSTLATDNLGIPGQGTMVSVILRKKGTTHAGNTYDDDTVHVLIWTGFHYSALVERSHRKLQQLWDSGTLYKDLLKEAIDLGIYDATMEDVSTAVQEVNNNLEKVLAGASKPFDPDNVGGDRVPSHWGPLIVNGATVPGCKKYIRQGSTIPYGTIYIDGVKLGERVLEPANRTWKTTSKNKTVLKDALRAKLPVGLYVRYSLDETRVKKILIGADAVAHTKAEKLPIDPGAIRSLFKIAI